VVIDAGVDGNDARFINHSCDPNCDTVIEGGRVFIEAKRTIQPGEELGYEYGLTWESTDDPEDAPGVERGLLLGPGDERVWLRPVWNDAARTEIGVSFPASESGQSAPYNYKFPTPTVATARGAAVVAKVIVDKILPDYRVALRDTRDRIEAERTEQTQATANANRIAAAAPGAQVCDVKGCRRQPKVDLYHSQDFTGCVADVTVYADRVKFDSLDVTVDECVALLDLLRKMRSGG
jgi:hypothetical protein